MSTMIAVRVSKEMHKEIDEQAASENIAKSDFIRNAISDKLESTKVETQEQKNQNIKKLMGTLKPSEPTLQNDKERITEYLEEKYK